MLRNAGERGLLEQFDAIVVAKPKAWHHSHRTDESERARFREDQRAPILRALDYYNPGAILVFGPDFGHTDPQYVLPYGGQVTVNGPGRQLLVSY
jgi:muramoyltetrapeptide carboxypeptidase LdcA involved in peptidoglycan recycling